MLLENLLLAFNLILFAVLIIGGILAVRTRRVMAYHKRLSASMMKHMDEGLAIIDTAGSFEFASPHFRKLLELDKLSVIGGDVMNLLPGSIYQMFLDYQAMDKKNQTESFTKLIQFGESHIRIGVFGIPNGKHGMKYVISLQDQTRQIRMEQQLSSQIEEVQFHLKTKETMLANISHELRTPLNAIVGLNHILEGSDLNERQKDLVSKIQVSSDHLTALLNDILDFSMLKTKEITLDPSPIFLRDFMSDVIEKFSPAVSLKGIRLITDYQFDPELCLQLDPVRLEQILSNLLKNACEFTKVGFIRIRVCVLKEFQDTVTLKFSVEDTGVGLAQEEVPGIFAEFHQTDENLSREHQGSGLGLPICRCLVEHMGGALWVESKKEIGSTFFFTITAPKCGSLPENNHAISSLQGCGQQILVVEDTPINYEVVEELLSKVDLQCDHAPSGLSALTMCEQKGKSYYKAILMDIHMPLMDGYETSRKLKAMGVTSPIIALTATNMTEDSFEKHRDLFEAFIRKPFKYTQLYNALSPFVENNAPPKSTVGSTAISFDARAEAIENLGGNLALYEKHLSKFKKNYASAGSALDSYLSAGDRSEARILAHSIKGLAGMLGLTLLARSAENLEIAIDSGTQELESEITAFKNNLRQVVEG